MTDLTQHGPRVYVDSPLTGSSMPSPKVSLYELEQLRRRAREQREEVPFFRALLDAAVYAHAPLSDDSGRMRFIQFAHPDTQVLLLPCFSDASQAHAAAQGMYKVLAMTGRDFFELTLGATVMLNPNEDQVTLYSEEIQALLESGTMAHINVETLPEPKTMGFRLPTKAPAWLRVWLEDLFGQLPYVEVGYLVEMVPPDNLKNITLVVAFGVAPVSTERAGRAISTKLQPKWEGLDVAVDLIPFDAAGELPVWIHSLGIEPFYIRVGAG